MDETELSQDQQGREFVIHFGEPEDLVQYELLIWRDLDSPEVHFLLRAHEIVGDRDRVMREVTSITIPASGVRDLADQLVGPAQ